MKGFISILLLILSTGLVAQTTAISVIENPVISNLEEIQERMSTRQAVVEYQFVNIDLNSLQNKTSIHIEFFDVNVVLKRDKLDRRLESSYTWYGLSEDKTITAVVTVLNNSIQGMISSSNGSYRIETFGNTYVLERIDQAKYPKEECSNFSDVSNNESFKTDMTEGEPDPVDLPPHDCKLRVLVMYTPAAAAVAGVNMAALAQLAVDEMNWSFSNSSIYRQAELVFVEEISFTETSTIEQDIEYWKDNNDGVMDDVHLLREQYAADVCVLLSNTSKHIEVYCGIAASLRSSSDYAFALVAWDCATGYYSFAHEIGHLFGCQHALVDDTDVYLDVDAPFAHGYKHPNANWRTLMSYTCKGGCTRLPYWSNPNISYNGSVMGSSKENNAKMVEDNFERMMFLSPNGQSLTVTNSDVNGTWSKTIYAGGTMQTSGYVNIQWGRNYKFRAEESILMQAGFEVESSTEFEAIVLPCGEEGSGKLDYSAINDISFKTFTLINEYMLEGKENLELYPNPVSTMINLKNINPDISYFDIIIHSIEGKERLNLVGIKPENGLVTNKINVEMLPKGIYFINILLDNNEQRVLKFIKD